VYSRNNYKVIQSVTETVANNNNNNNNNKNKNKNKKKKNPTVAMNYSERQLFGGAITSDLPVDWKDLSDVRPVPDNQECFQDSFVTDRPGMLVIEILERQEQVDDQDASYFFFNELAERNDVFQTKNNIRFHKFDDDEQDDDIDDNDDAYSATALRSSDASVVSGENSIQICSGFGYQNVAMGRDHDDSGNSRREQQELKCIRIDLCVLRLSKQDTDLVITVSKPVDVPNSNEETSFGMMSSMKTNPILHHIISTFQIRDWKLFG
ncbi:MAG: hypothetical protein ACI8RD_004333, partial [Bacillariaceae sp.]|jgi:hypothetical protein